MNTIKIVTTQNIELEYDLASLGDRIVGFIIDWLILIAYIVVIFGILIGASILDFDNPILFLFIIPPFFYHLVSEMYMNGQSVGKRVMNIKVISLNGEQPTVGQYLIRWLFRLIDFSATNCLGALICVAVSEKKQRIGDIVAGTTLINTNSRTAFRHTIYVPTVDAGYTVSFPQVSELTDKDMQLVKEVILLVHTTGNYVLASQAAEKIKHTLQVQTSMEPLPFLQTVIADYNHLTSVGE